MNGGEREFQSEKRVNHDLGPVSILSVPYYAAVGAPRKLSGPLRNFLQPPSVWSRMASGDGSWRCTGGKSAGETERERERDRGKEKRKRQARAGKTRAFVVCRKGGAGGGQVRNLGKRRGGIIIVQARTRSSPPAIR